MAQEIKLSAVLTFFGGVLCLIAFVQVAITAWAYWNEKKVQDTWTPAQGTIVEREVFRRTGRSGSNTHSKTYNTRFTVKFAVGAQDVTSFVETDFGTSSQTTMEALAARFPVGTGIKVKYNPQNQAQLVISDQESDLAYLGPKKSAMWAAIVMAAGIVLLVVGKRMTG